MTGIDFVRKCLVAPPRSGKHALLYATAALAVPTLMRASVDGMVSGVGFAPYLPFVLLSAIVLDWRYSAAVAVAAAALGDFLFVGRYHELFEGPTDIFGLTLFLISSALTIGLVVSVRKFIADPIWLHGPGASTKSVVFSAKGGQAYVSWYGERSFVPLGPEEEVADMMEDFLAQVEFGRRLAGQAQ